MTAPAERVNVPSIIVASVVELPAVSKSIVSLSRPQARTTPAIDLATVRETISYMHDDMERAPELARVRNALAMALLEIDRVETSRRTVTAGDVTRARFIPWPGRR